ncbi:MAG: cobalamin B12-binding domain-containing protein [Oscillospiraceae bacterium]|jgi:radical SAM superfamily enzyme YgiQ (UPF0313 family)|nr:cobalamin B12-binding domain-containing protein [Oscillospiraceae bacterium]
MKVTIVIPPYINKGYYMPALGVYVLARKLMDLDITVRVVDYSFDLMTGKMIASSRIYKECANDILTDNPDAICFSCNCMTILPAMQISKLIKQTMNVPIIIGGPIATTSADEILKYTCVNYVIVGEGENSLPELILSLQKKKFAK